ncbi:MULTISPECIES: hypothetical protein [unclassified Microcoleus]|uniref:hypothetical protein n=1 Tax=unclassified Microcoleus TaxID=2642155 RepID=UPI001D35DBFF|nr:MULTISPECIES: hypothetical protein [unclassified Microcoleus]MCC3441328.1 hypothetical protein [Microcoleus sp. PH2017_03_ELD_O_A]MCC3469658.1 hypothetical protein [Microcoleus sp. PH2017_06_SFM_O_A]MCC3503279.1 hypothetical protein [Microcoleus sp. PH2017_19_SFW_U_A]MCC3413526.1 hypothetical protein [Microcoleus sp. PH2017_02_FOX_O_A]MCC3447903.1 hypothetical protein [Microcoleus sp. PH2017_09_SFU_O_A]
MPTPQQNSFFVEQASCLLLKIVQHMRSPFSNKKRSHFNNSQPKLVDRIEN